MQESPSKTWTRHLVMRMKRTPRVVRVDHYLEHAHNMIMTEHTSSNPISFNSHSAKTWDLY